MEKTEAKKEGKKEEKGQKSSSDQKPDERLADIKEILQRTQAEFENYKKRVDREKEDFVKFAQKDLIMKLLPILDNFKLAMDSTKNCDEFVKGVELIFSEFHELMEKQGLKAIKAKGEQFDPYNHEALLQEDSEEEPGIVLEELQTGYLLNDKVIRHTKVKISKSKTDGQEGKRGDNDEN